MPVLQFSSYEDVAGSESDSCESTAHPQEVRSGALLTMSKVIACTHTIFIVVSKVTGQI